MSLNKITFVISYTNITQFLFIGKLVNRVETADIIASKLS